MMRFVFIYLLLFFCLFVSARQKVSYDSADVQQRSITSSSLDKYKNDKDFQYEKEQVELPSLWDRFWMWFWSKYDDIMGTAAGRATMNFIYWLAGLGAVSFFVYRVMRMNKVALFINPSLSSNAFTIQDENIHDISFEAAIEEALQQDNFRLAVRLQYLKTLKILADKNLIAWLPNKTNTDYLRELNGSVLQQSFKKNTWLFEYAWYGNLAVTAENYEEMEEQFLQFQSQLLSSERK